MTIRILLRALPLLVVALATLGAVVRDLPGERAHQTARLQTDRLSWIAHGANCPELRENPGFFTCRGRPYPTKPGAEH